MRDFISRQAKNIKPSGIRKFFDVVSEIPGAISLGVGEPDFVTPWAIRDAAVKSIQKGHTQYTSNKGLPKLRAQVSRFLESRYNLSYSGEEIVITVGASEGIDIALRAIIDPGDEILVPEPSYVSYAPCIALAGGVAVPVCCEAKEQFKITKEMLEAAITPKTKALILPYPNNPTGATMTRAELERIAPAIIKNDLLVISDEIYAELTYNGCHTSIAALKGMRERTILISGFSKAFAMTGWRIGYVAAPDDLIKYILKIHQFVIMCAPTAGQHAALFALEDGFNDNFSIIAEMRKEYDKRRKFIFRALNDMGLDCFEPTGAFYVFPSVKATGLDGEEFANKLLASHKLAVVPGAAFGDCGKYHIRCSYAYSMTALSEAVSRLESFVRPILKK